ncbi:hypothetical protein PN462_08430 [Spirulina sp. CS-785/01]|uniref:hypothetical protein n=1 Tax=Spirulina sp. CS-785/01 TaxID=3021716 RepID=UPI00232FA0C5|nr:hypothetical protein [Spirulina sp. CS-785/01]MDB9313125.1 hypothetical protein [Spirulina sp. CS-785/01]
MQINSSHLLLDACCTLNLCASGQFLAILQSLPVQVAIVQEVEQELKRIENIEQFEQAIEQSLLIIVNFESEAEAETFVNYAATLDDGEAATGAIAFHREWSMATDEKKAINFFAQETSKLQILSTLAIIKFWSESEQIESQVLRDILNAVRVKGSYVPHNQHSLKPWWDENS